MSHLLLPRIHFAGVFVVNPGTGNNEDTMQPTLCKGGQVKVNIDSLAGYGANEANFRHYMESPGPLRGLWNYYGDNDCYFNRAEVTSVELRESNQQRAECLPEQDSLIGAGVALNDALMVDVNSHSAKGPQIFADEFVIQKDALLCRGQPTTAYVRWYNFQRNKTRRGFPGHSATFQFSLPKGEAPFKIAEGNSRALQALQAAMADPQVFGLTVRLCFYFTNMSFEPGLSPAERDRALAQAYADPARLKKLENPAIGQVVGTLGPWREGELASVTMGRLLINRTNKQSSCGPAIAVIDEDRRVAVLDLANTFPEQDESLNKVNWGEVQLVLQDELIEHSVGPVGYDRETYKKTSGVVEVPYTAEIADILKKQAPPLLALRSSSLALPLLVETAYMIDADDKCLYMHEGETRALAIHARAFGQASAQRVNVAVTYVKDRSTSEAVASEVLKDLGYEINAKPVIQVLTPPLMPVTPGQPATVTVQATSVGAALVYCRADAASSPNANLDFYFNIRVLPNDSALAQTPEERLTFDLVYKEVLQYYHLLHPAMSQVFDLSQKEQWTPRWAKRVLERINPALKSRYKYMPRTRDMSDGRRALLQRWCQAVIANPANKDSFNDPQ